jgi:hypothetical protein
MEQERKGASKSQKVGGGILLATIVIGLVASFYMMRNNKRN